MKLSRIQSDFDKSWRISSQRRRSGWNIRCIRAEWNWRNPHKWFNCSLHTIWMIVINVFRRNRSRFKAVVWGGLSLNSNYLCFFAEPELESGVYFDWLETSFNQKCQHDLLYYFLICKFARKILWLTRIIINLFEVWSKHNVIWHTHNGAQIQIN